MKTAIACMVAGVVLASTAHAQDGAPVYKEKTWTEVIGRLPCSDFRHNADGSWTLLGTLMVAEAGRTFTDLTFTKVPPEDTGAKVLDLRCAAQSGEQ